MGYLVIVVCLFLIQFVPRVTCLVEQGEKVVFMTGPRDGKVDLPCYLQPRNDGDRHKLVLWYKAGINTPLFSHDDRRGARKLPRERHEIDERQFVHFEKDSATLTKTNLKASDGGMYECRVDFYRSPTSTSLYNLTILLPPDELEVEGWPTKDRIIAGSRRILPHHLSEVIAGPFLEEQKMHLSCTARGGSPRPNVTWWRNGSLVDRGWEVKGLGMVCNDLVVPKLTRDWQASELMCRATTSPELEELTVSLKVDMILSPFSVRISAPKSVQAGSKLSLSCTIIGARPVVTVEWLKGNKVIDRENDVVLTSGDTESVSLFHATFDVEAEDDQTEVTCSAVNAKLPHIVVKNTTTINVLYAPEVEASLGRSLDASSLSAGDDVYFSCDVRANPPGGSVLWYREGVLQKSEEGVVLSGSDLVLQKVSKEKAGNYWCESGNEISTTASKPITLKLNYLPECRSVPSIIHIHEEPINVTCNVESIPPVSKFTWRWNYTTDDFAFQVKEERLKNSGNQWSTVEIRTKHEKTENQLLEFFCYGINDVGIQDEPCKFIIEYSSTPAPSCLLLNITSSSLTVQCSGLETNDSSATYRVEAYEKSGKLISEVLSKEATFSVAQLEPVTHYSLRVYVTKESTTPVLVSAMATSTVAEYSVKETRPKPRSSSKSSSSSISLHIVGWSLTAASIIILTTFLYCLARRRMSSSRQGHKIIDHIPSEEDAHGFLDDASISQKSSNMDIKVADSVGSSPTTETCYSAAYDETVVLTAEKVSKTPNSNVHPTSKSYYPRERRLSDRAAIFLPTDVTQIERNSNANFERPAELTDSDATTGPYGRASDSTCEKIHVGDRELFVNVLSMISSEESIL